MIKNFVERVQEKKLFDKNRLRHANKTEDADSPAPSAHATGTLTGLDTTAVTIEVPVAKLEYHHYVVNRLWPKLK